MVNKRLESTSIEKWATLIRSFFIYIQHTGEKPVVSFITALRVHNIHSVYIEKRLVFLFRNY